MLNDILIKYEVDINSVPGDSVALAWVIDGDCLYDLPVPKDYVSMFLEHDEVVDISEDYPDYDGIVVRFLKNGEVVEELKTTEYFGTILLSEPTVVKLNMYPYGRYVQSPYAKFDGEKFIITNRDVTHLPAWHPKNPNTPKGYFEEFTK
jgi:hypothetical protein